MKVVASAPQTTRRLLAVDPDMAEILVAVALHKASLSSVSLYLDNNIVQAAHLEYFLRVYISC
jgi:hypothetical protein